MNGSAVRLSKIKNNNKAIFAYCRTIVKLNVNIFTTGRCCVVRERLVQQNGCVGWTNRTGTLPEIIRSSVSSVEVL